MGVELDHVFVCTDAGAPQAERLVEFGLREGQANQHPGQGTANRRFFFANAMLELLFVQDEAEARSALTARTRLWERWQGRRGGASPFGICVRPAGPLLTQPPFASWSYRPAYLLDSAEMRVAETALEEPMWFYLSFTRRADCERRFVEHPIGGREITGLELISPAPARSDVAQTLIQGGILSSRAGDTHLLGIELDGHRRGEVVDFRPGLPLILRL